MPAMPEIRDRNREVGLTEVEGHLDAEKLRYAPHHVDSARKIGVLVDGVEKDAVDDDAPRRRGVNRVECVGDNGDEDICDGELLEDAVADEKQRPARVMDVEAMGFVELGGKVVEAIDGALNELRKVRDEQQEAREVALGRALAEVTVDDVAD